MPVSRIQDDRIRRLNAMPVNPEGAYVLYWMQQSQRADFNHALEYAVDLGNNLRLPTLVVFGLAADYPEANFRHYWFMLEGLRETRDALAERGIKLIALLKSPPDAAVEMAGKAAAVICDKGYLRHQRQWRNRLASSVGCSAVEVESDLIAPVESVSDKAEYAARTIRPRLLRYLLNHPINSLDTRKPLHDSLSIEEDGVDISNIEQACRLVNANPDVTPVARFFRGGSSEAKRRYTRFLENEYAGYAANRNQPSKNYLSHMSPYLHFGQVSAVWMAGEALKTKNDPDKQAYLEELFVRRELAANFVYFTEDYDQYSSLPEWSRATLARHRMDKRDFIYGPDQLETAGTHDPYWNAAMQEMKYTGYMHNYMRMYWGKKILEWSASPQDAYDIALYLNNKYFLDGRDFNSYANVAWVFGKHDRPWPEKPVFGKVRSMSAAGLERKFDMSAYISKVRAYINETKL